MENECDREKYSFLVLQSLFSLPILSLGIFGAIESFKYKQYNICNKELSYWIIAACVIDICVPIFTLLACFHSLIFNNKKEVDTNKILITNVKILLISQSILLVSGIWALYTYNNISSECHDLIILNFREIWTFIILNMIQFSVGICMIVIVSFCTCWIWMCVKYNP